jgi:hypothetical protein
MSNKNRFFLFGGLCLFLVLGVGITSLTFSQPVNPAEEADRMARLEEFTNQRKRQIDSDSRQLRAYAERSLDDALDPIFSRFEEQVPAFGEWAFRWRTSYILLREGTRSSALWALEGEPRAKPFAETVSGNWNEFIAAHFEDIVIKPAGGASLLRAAYKRWWEKLTATAFETASDNALVISLYRGGLIGIDATAPALPSDHSLDGHFRPMGQVTEKLEMRMVRPVAARLAIRPPVVAAVAAVGETISGGIGEFVLVGGPLSMAATIGTVLGVDYLLSRADEKMNRSDFEMELRAALRQAKAEIRNRWLERADSEIERRMQVPRALIKG